MLRKTVSGIQGGIMVAIGGCVFLSCDNKYIGAILFSVALLCICCMEYSLYTGKIGFIPEKHGREELSVLLFALLGNIIASAIFGWAAAAANPAMRDTALSLCAAKLGQTALQTFLRAMFCGILMYLSVSIFRNKKSPIGILFCIPCFILSGFEHSIADMFYFFTAGTWSLPVLVFIAIVLAGNSVGSMLLPLLSMVGKEVR